MMMNFDDLPEFKKEFKRLAKKYRSLPNDLEEFKRIIAVVPLGNGKHFNAITENEICVIVKARLFCRYLKGSSMRVIYAFYRDNPKIDFIEIYFKGEKKNEDGGRIKDYLKNLK